MMWLCYMYYYQETTTQNVRNWRQTELSLTDKKSEKQKNETLVSINVTVLTNSTIKTVLNSNPQYR